MTVYSESFLKSLQKNIAFLSIDISVLRKQVKPGGLEKCRRFCNEIELDLFFSSLYNNYSTYLNDQTDLLLKYCSNQQLHFGSARKVLNIFFRHIVYNGFLQNEYLKEQDLYSNNSIIAKLELPIDSKTANGLSTRKWISIKGLDPQTHQWYQELAKDESLKSGIARVHLDIEYWTPV